MAAHALFFSQNKGFISMLHARVWLMALVLLSASAGNALAEGFALYEYGARGVALGGAVMARKPDPSAVAYNPALITQLPGVNLMAGVTAVVPSGKMDWQDRDGSRGTTELRDSVWGIPHFYYTHQLSDSLFFGIGEFTRYGLGFEYPHDWPGRFNIYQVSLVSGSLNPNLAWKATDKLSIALGVELIYVSLDIKKRVMVNGNSALEVDSNITNADAWGVGGNIALHYQFNDQWALGLQYRSQARVHAYGDVEFTDVTMEKTLGPVGKGLFEQNFHDGTAHSVVVLPDSMSGGLSYTPIPELSIEVGAIWTRWSTFRDLDIHLPDGMPVSRNPKRWKDVWRLNAGVEYQALDWLTLRAGYVFDQSPMPEKYEDYLVPTGNRNIYSFGVGFHGEAWNLDLAYAFIKPQDRGYKADDGRGTIRSRTRDTNTQLFSVSLSYAF